VQHGIEPGFEGGDGGLAVEQPGELDHPRVAPADFLVLLPHGREQAIEDQAIERDRHQSDPPRTGMESVTAAGAWGG